MEHRRKSDKKGPRHHVREADIRAALSAPAGFAFTQIVTGQFRGADPDEGYAKGPSSFSLIGLATNGRVYVYRKDQKAWEALGHRVIYRG